VDATVDMLVRCPVCQTLCRVLRKNVFHKNQRECTLYGCSDGDCGTYILIKGFLVKVLSTQALVRLAAENSDIEAVIIRTKIDDLRAKERVLKQELTDTTLEIERLQEKLNARDTFWDRLIETN